MLSCTVTEQEVLAVLSNASVTPSVTVIEPTSVQSSVRLLCPSMVIVSGEHPVLPLPTCVAVTVPEPLLFN